MKYKVTFKFVRALIAATKGELPDWAIELIASQLGIAPSKLLAFVQRVAALSDSVLDTLEQVIGFKWTFGAAGPGHLTGGGGEDCTDVPELAGHDDVVAAFKAQEFSDADELTLPTIV